MSTIIVCILVAWYTLSAVPFGIWLCRIEISTAADDTDQHGLPVVLGYLFGPLFFLLIVPLLVLYSPMLIVCMLCHCILDDRSKP